MSEAEEQLRRVLREHPADAAHLLDEVLADAHRSREHTKQWYAERLERLKQMAKERGFWPEMAAILANGTATMHEPPSYAQLLNRAKHRAELAEEALSALREDFEKVRDALEYEAYTESSAAMQAIARIEPQYQRALEREKHWASVLGIPDGGRYRNDWDARLTALLEENKRLRADAERLAGVWRAVHLLAKTMVNSGAVVAQGWGKKILDTMGPEPKP